MGQRLANRWIAVAVWIAVIFTAIPFVRRLRDFFVARWPAELLAYAVMGVVAATAAGALLALQRRRGRVRPADVAWLAAITAGLIVWTRGLMGQPEEAVHFLEYGVLGVLLYRALSPDMDNTGVFIAAALLGILVGTVDEIIQWIVPDRYWDFRDLVLNGGASILVQIAIWRLAPRPSSTLTPQTARILCRLAAVEMLILTLCLAATPQRLDAVARTFPAFQSRVGTDNAISEYGYLHRLDERTFFRSRLSRSELEDQDRHRSTEVAAALDGSRGHYREFLRTVGSSRDPFTYEARVHIFARKRDLAEARKHPKGLPEHRRSMTAAARENQILERIFSDTLTHSTFLWPTRQRLTVESAQDPSELYVSRVAKHLITGLSERLLRLLMLAAVVALVIADVILGRLNYSVSESSKGGVKRSNSGSN